MRGNLFKLLLLLAILGGAAGWNYQRNAAVEDAQSGPYGNYSDEDLETLLAAYRDQIDHHTKNYRRVAARNVVVQEQGLLGDKIDEFERVQQISTHRRNMAARVTDNMVSLEQLEAEHKRRQRDRPVYKKYLRRLFTFPG